MKVFDSIEKTFVFLMGSHLIHRFKKIIIGHWRHDNGFQLYVEIEHTREKNTNSNAPKNCKLKRFGKVIAKLIAKFALKLALKMSSCSVFGI